MQFDHLRRREFITLLGGAAAWPLAVRALPAMPVTGFVGGTTADVSRQRVFRQSLTEAGHSEGESVAVEYCWGL